MPDKRHSVDLRSRIAEAVGVDRNIADELDALDVADAVLAVINADNGIYEPDAVEHLALIGEVDARVWAKTFVKTVATNPLIPTDEDTMLAWFASAIMAGYDRGQSDVR